VQWHPSTSNTTRQTVAGEVGSSLASGRDIANTISAELYHKSTVVNQDVNNGHLVVGSLAARDYKGVGNQYVNEGKVIVEDSVLMRQREGKPGGGKGPLLSNNKSLTLSGGNDQTLFTPIGFSHTQGLSAQPSEDAWPTLRTEGNGMAVAFPIQDGREMEKNQNGIGVADDGTPAYTLDQTGAQAVAYSIREDAKANTFSATELDKANSLSALRPSPQSHHAQMFIAEQPTMAVRRLTPLECERLMGWPDDWTAGQSDTHRYKQCGNGVASPVAQWIAEQLLKL
jgi:hypothetical protein